MTTSAALVLLAVAMQAPAPTAERVVVIAGDDTEFAGVVEAAFRARGLHVLDDSERHGLDGRETTRSAGDREIVRTRLLEARAAWRQLNLDGAEAGATAAVDEAMRLERPEDHLDLVVDALVFLAALRLGQGDDTDATASLRLATRLEPERSSLDAALHPPSLVQAWADARAINEAAAVSVVVVRPRLIGAAATSVEVRIDGVMTDVRGGLVELARGPHLLSLRAEGCQTRSRVIDVNADDVVVEDVLHVDADIAERARLVTAVRAGDSSALAGLVQRTGADLLVALEAQGRIVAQRRGGSPVAMPSASDADPVLLVDAVLLATAPPEMVSPAPPLVVGPEAFPWGWLGATAGVVAVGVATAVVVWAVVPGNPPAPPPRPVVTIWGVQ